MDPNTTLDELLAWAQEAVTEYRDDAKAAEAFLALDGWIRTGGFLPDAWERERCFEAAADAARTAYAAAARIADPGARADAYVAAYAAAVVAAAGDDSYVEALARDVDVVVTRTEGQDNDESR